MEAACHEESAFVTLTIAGLKGGAYGPPEKKEWSLDRFDLPKFIKRLRSRLGRSVRYFGVGEYGDQTFRPHYHVALFGVSPLLEEEIGKAWSLGRIHVGLLEKDSAQYIAGYVCKKMTNKDDERLGGRLAERSWSSRRPGIGGNCVEDIVRALRDSPAAMSVLGDVPDVARVAGRRWPIGRYLREKVRLSLGLEKGEPQEVKRQRVAEYLAMTEVDRTAREKKREAQYDQVRGRLKIARSRGVL